MKKPILMLLAVCLQIISITQAQTLFTYGKYPVSKQEFLEAYKKNNTSSPTEKSYADYLEMYIRYKLKVQAAYDMRLDTIPSQLADLQDFRKQVIGNYLADEKILQGLVKEAMVHSAQDIRISHIYIPFAGKDSLEAKNKASRALQELNDGKPFETVAQLYSADTSVQRNKGDIGWISAFVLPYPLEKLAYETKLNQNSRIYRSSSAYHIFRRTGERPAAGMIQAAQVLLPITPDMNPEAVVKTYKLADSIYTALKNGANFGSLAQQYSSDNASFNNQGVMQAFYPGTYDISFEEPVFALQKDNDLTQPFRTVQGLHIVKRVGIFRYSTDTANAAAIVAMKTRVLNDPRHKLAYDAINKKASKQLGVTITPLPAGSMEQYTKAFFSGDATGRALIAPEKVLATIYKKPLTLKNYDQYLFNNANRLTTANPALSGQEIFNQFLDAEIMESYQQNLEKFNPDFARQLKEFRDGNMIFEAMQANIWDKAVNDEAGLKRYYDKHRDKYTWKESVEAVIFTCVDSAAAQNFYQELKGNPAAWKSITDKSKGVVQADSGRFEIEQLPAYGNSGLKSGTVTAPVLRTDDLTTNFIYVLHNLPANLPRTFEDAKGFVLNDYQTILEEDWISSLKKKYPVKVNSTVLKSLNR